MSKSAHHRHCHPDPFDFAQDKGHRRISPSRGFGHLDIDLSPLAQDDGSLAETGKTLEVGIPLSFSE